MQFTHSLYSLRRMMLLPIRTRITFTLSLIVPTWLEQTLLTSQEDFLFKNTPSRLTCRKDKLIQWLLMFWTRNLLRERRIKKKKQSAFLFLTFWGNGSLHYNAMDFQWNLYLNPQIEQFASSWIWWNLHISTRCLKNVSYFIVFFSHWFFHESPKLAGSAGSCPEKSAPLKSNPLCSFWNFSSIMALSCWSFVNGSSFGPPCKTLSQLKCFFCFNNPISTNPFSIVHNDSLGTTRANSGPSITGDWPSENVSSKFSRKQHSSLPTFHSYSQRSRSQRIINVSTSSRFWQLKADFHIVNRLGPLKASSICPSNPFLVFPIHVHTQKKAPLENSNNFSVHVSQTAKKIFRWFFFEKQTPRRVNCKNYEQQRGNIAAISSMGSRFATSA